MWAYGYPEFGAIPFTRIGQQLGVFSLTVHENEFVITIAPDGEYVAMLLNTDRNLAYALDGRTMFSERDLNNLLLCAIGEVASDMFPNAAIFPTL